MATIRIETVADEASGQVYAQVHLDNSTLPLMRSEPDFVSHEALVEEILEMCRTRFSDHTPYADDPTIGV